MDYQHIQLNCKWRLDNTLLSDLSLQTESQKEKTRWCERKREKGRDERQSRVGKQAGVI